MVVERPVMHIRLPERSDAVGGQEPRPGAPLVAKAPVDPRTASQDPALKTEVKNS